MRSVFALAVVVLLSALPTACGGSAAAPTAAPTTTSAATATAAASPTPLATATQPPTAGSGQIAFAGIPEGASESAIYLVGSDGAGLEAIWTWETVGSQAVYLVWSPDGRHLAFFGHDAGDESSGLYVLDADQGSLTHLVEVRMLWYPPVWSPDGSQLYISVPRSALADGGILAVPADGSAAPSLLTAEPEMGRLMTISPDGQMISAMVGGSQELGVLDVDDQQMRVVIDDLIVTSAPVWSPDSRQIAFIGQPSGGTNQLYVVAADGTGLSQLSDVQLPDVVAFGFAAADPVWSPDGQQIAFTVRQASSTEVYLASVDGSDTRNLSNDPQHADTGPSWSPDGREVAFVSEPADASGGPWIADIRVIMADGTNPRTVVAGVEFENFMELGGLPEWRPTAP